MLSLFSMTVFNVIRILRRESVVLFSWKLMFVCINVILFRASSRIFGFSFSYRFSDSVCCGWLLLCCFMLVWKIAYVAR